MSSGENLQNNGLTEVFQDRDGVFTSDQLTGRDLVDLLSVKYTGQEGALQSTIKNMQPVFNLLCSQVAGLIERCDYIPPKIEDHIALFHLAIQDEYYQKLIGDKFDSSDFCMHQIPIPEYLHGTGIVSKWIQPVFWKTTVPDIRKQFSSKFGRTCALSWYYTRVMQLSMGDNPNLDYLALGIQEMFDVIKDSDFYTDDILKEDRYFDLCDEDMSKRYREYTSQTGLTNDLQVAMIRGSNAPRCPDMDANYIGAVFHPNSHEVSPGLFYTHSQTNNRQVISTMPIEVKTRSGEKKIIPPWFGFSIPYAERCIEDIVDLINRDGEKKVEFKLSTRNVLFLEPVRRISLRYEWDRRNEIRSNILKAIEQRYGEKSLEGVIMNGVRLEDTNSYDFAQ